MRAKMLMAALSLACVATTTSSYANTYPFTPPPSSGIVWIVVKPDIVRTWDKDYYKIAICVNWGSFSRCESYTKLSDNFYVISLRHLDNMSYPMTVKTSVGTVTRVLQGSNPTGPYDTQINW